MKPDARQNRVDTTSARICKQPCVSGGFVIETFDLFQWQGRRPGNHHRSASLRSPLKVLDQPLPFVKLHQACYAMSSGNVLTCDPFDSMLGETMCCQRLAILALLAAFAAIPIITESPLRLGRSPRRACIGSCRTARPGNLLLQGFWAIKRMRRKGPQ